MSQQSQTPFVMDCNGMQGADLAACLSFNNTVKLHDIDLNTTSGQQLAFQFHRAIYETYQRQINDSAVE